VHEPPRPRGLTGRIGMSGANGIPLKISEDILGELWDVNAEIRCVPGRCCGCGGLFVKSNTIRTKAQQKHNGDERREAHGKLR